ncbi:MAG: hypothetical protein ABSF63_04460 [Candidatus Bathyarchaeia archaeon]
MDVGVLSGLDLGGLSYDVSLISSMAIILGSLFVVVQIRQTNRMIRVAGQQAEAAAVQARLTTEQLKQDHELANMDLIMRLYEFANTAEVQAAWLTVLNSNISTYGDFESLSKSDQVAFFQIGALFESLGVLVERGIVKVNVIEDMFLTRLAWESMKPFVSGVRERYGEEENYAGFQRLYEKIVLAEKEETE